MKQYIFPQTKMERETRVSFATVDFFMRDSRFKQFEFQSHFRLSTIEMLVREVVGIESNGTAILR